MMLELRELWSRWRMFLNALSALLLDVICACCFLILYPYITDFSLEDSYNKT